MKRNLQCWKSSCSFILQTWFESVIRINVPVSSPSRGGDVTVYVFCSLIKRGLQLQEFIAKDWVTSYQAWDDLKWSGSLHRPTHEEQWCNNKNNNNRFPFLSCKRGSKSMENISKMSKEYVDRIKKIQLLIKWKSSCSFTLLPLQGIFLGHRKFGSTFPLPKKASCDRIALSGWLIKIGWAKYKISTDYL